MATEERPSSRGPRHAGSGSDGPRGGLPFRRGRRLGPAEPSAPDAPPAGDPPGAGARDSGGLKLHWPEHELDHLVRPDEVGDDLADALASPHPATAEPDATPDPVQPEPAPDPVAVVETPPEPKPVVDAKPDPAPLPAPAPELPVGRPATVDGAMHAVSMRLEHLLAESASFRAAVADRLAEHADLMTRLTRSQADDIEAHRQATDRVLADLRRSMASQEETARRLAGRLDEVADAVSGLHDQLRTVATETHGAGADAAGLRAELTAMQRQLSAAVQRLGDDVTSTVRGDLHGVRDELRKAAPATAPDAGVRSLLTALREDVVAISNRLSALATREPQRQLQQLADQVTHLGVQVGAGGVGIESVRSDVADVTTRLDALVESVGQLGAGLRRRGRSAAGEGQLDAIHEEIAALRDEVGALRRRIPVKGKPPPTLTPAELELLADAVAARVQELTGRAGPSVSGEEPRGRRWR